MMASAKGIDLKGLIRTIPDYPRKGILFRDITTLIAVQNHEQHYGIEHMAVDTDDYAGTLATLRKNGVRILEELPPNNGRHVAFVECPDGAQMEIIEKT